jgi:hypothetical protein
MSLNVIPLIGTHGDLQGVWIREPDHQDAQLRIHECTAAFGKRAEKFKAGTFRRVDNSHHSEPPFSGGAFLMLGSARAPNEVDFMPSKLGLWDRLLGRRVRSGGSHVARDWFTNPSKRAPPRSPQDFDLFQIPRHGLPEWVKGVATKPLAARCVVLGVEDMPSAPRTLYNEIKQLYGLTPDEACALFDQYMGAACPRCFAGITGNVLQSFSAMSAAKLVIGAGGAVERLLSGRCHSCESKTYCVVWFGSR